MRQVYSLQRNSRLLFAIAQLAWRLRNLYLQNKHLNRLEGAVWVFSSHFLHPKIGKLWEILVRPTTIR